VSAFIAMPLVAGMLWLVHVILGATGHRAYRYSCRLLFGGLSATAVVFFLIGFQVDKSVPPEWKNNSLGGVVEFLLALETTMVLLALALLEVIRVAVTQTIEVARAKTACQRPDPANVP